MSAYDKIKPKYDQTWLKQKKTKWIEIVSERLLHAKKSNLIGEEESKMPVRLSTKDQLKALGINIGMHNDINSLDGSFGDASTGFDDLDIDALESEDDGLQDQD